MIQLHYLQLEILKNLLFSDGLRLSEFKLTSHIENSQLLFHVESLIKDGLVDKNDHIYKLTAKGKEYANTMDSEKVQVKKQGKISVIQCCMRRIKDENEFLIYTRMKHPFYGSQGYASGKIDYGEKAIDAAVRELKEETNLEGNPELFMVEHHIVFNKETKELLEDKYFYFYRFINPKGELKPNNEGLFEWVKESSLREYFIKPFETVDRLMYITQRIKDFNHELTFEEINHFADNF